MHESVPYSRCLPLLAAFAAVALVATPGCTRNFYRQRADKDVEGVITQKNVFPDWQVKNWHVYPDPRARFADPTNPDRPPYPPDDYAARLLSPNPQRPTKKSGVGRIDGDGYLCMLQQWDAQNRATEGAVKSAAPGAQPEALPAPQPAAPKVGPPPGAAQAGAQAPPKPPEVHPEPQMPAAPSVARPAVAEFGPWVAARPHMPGPVVIDRGDGPAITELRPPVVMVAVGEIEPNDKAIPAAATAPAEAGPGGAALPTIPLAPVQQQPTPKPKEPPPATAPAPQPVPDAPPQPLPLPKPTDPKVTPPPPRPGDPVGREGANAPPTGDPAADYLRALEVGQPGYRITLEQAVELAVINGREFQDRREDLYLAALSVTLERFSFAAQAFATEQAIYRATGSELANAGRLWTLNGTAGFSKLFPTGGTALVRLANQVVLDLSNGKPTVAVSNLSLTLAQPFLRGGGYAVTLEPLTLAERNLLYAIRSYARFRKVFFVAIAAGQSARSTYTNNPYGFQGLSPNLGRGIGGNLTAPSIGYFQLLQLRATVNNQRRNVASLERLLRLYQAFREGGQQSPLQVGQVEVQLLNSRGSLLGSGSANATNAGIRAYLDALDNFKLQLGLPLTVGLDPDDSLLEPIREQLARFDELFAQARALEVEGAKFSPNEPVGDFRRRWLTLFTQSPLVRGTEFARTIGKRWESWSPAALTEDQVRARLAKLREERRKLLDARAERELKKLPEPPAEAGRISDLSAEIELGEFELRVREYEAQPWAKLQVRERATAQDSAFTAAFNAFFLVMLEAQNERLAKLYANWPKLPALPVQGIDVLKSTLEEAYVAGVQAALLNRLDLMNARAQVVDAWRQIAVIANSLRGVFNVQYDLNSGTPAGGNSPFAFSGTRSTNAVTFNYQLPLVRRAERNNYRAALIAYQRQRRTLMAFEDNIANDVRGDLRQLRTLAELYRIQQRAVELGYAQVNNAEAVLFAPPVPGAGSDAGSAAALTQQVLQNLNILLQAQNALYTLWVQYLTARMQLYLDIEQIPLDDRGVWCDELFNRTTDGPDQQQPGERQRPGERLPAPRPADGDPRP